MELGGFGSSPMNGCDRGTPRWYPPSGSVPQPFGDSAFPRSVPSFWSNRSALGAISGATKGVSSPAQAFVAPFGASSKSPRELQPGEPCLTRSFRVFPKNGSSIGHVAIMVWRALTASNSCRLTLPFTTLQASKHFVPSLHLLFQLSLLSLLHHAGSCSSLLPRPKEFRPFLEFA